MKIDFYNTGMDAYEQGNIPKAVEWFEKGLEDPRCHYALATLYYNGQGVKRDFKRATEYYATAAEAGIVPAQVSAGFAYANAMGVPQDFERAAHFLEMAVAKGDDAAKITLAEIYAMGKAGGSRKEAARLLREVLSHGSSEEAMDVYNKYELHKISL